MAEFVPHSDAVCGYLLRTHWMGDSAFRSPTQAFPTTLLTFLVHPHAFPIVARRGICRLLNFLFRLGSSAYRGWKRIVWAFIRYDFALLAALSNGCQNSREGAQRLEHSGCGTIQHSQGGTYGTAEHLRQFALRAKGRFLARGEGRSLRVRRGNRGHGCRRKDRGWQ